MRIGYLGTIIGEKKSAKSTPGSIFKSFSASFDPEKPQLKSFAKITVGGKVFVTDNALWDTGATVSVISQPMAENIAADPVDSGASISATDRKESDIYLATVELSGGIIFHDVELWAMELPISDVEIIIGMDIISRGKLTIESINGVPTFSFGVYQ